MSDSQALIFTADFFTPVVDDPCAFGAIAAANALSDVYATGGEPILALNLAAFPPDLEEETVADILRGGAEKALEAGCPVAGGHTIMDPEPKYGMAVAGIARPDELFLKTALREGDLLVLTKPLGTGVVTTAAKEDRAEAGEIAEAVASMKRLNRDAARAFKNAGVRAATDVTGFGFAGHALELADKSGLALEVFARSLPFLPGARRLAAEGSLPGGALRNRSYYASRVEFAPALDEVERALFFSPETSGGLLAGIREERLETCMRELRAAGVKASVVGRVLPRVNRPGIRVVDACVVDACVVDACVVDACVVDASG